VRAPTSRKERLFNDVLTEVFRLRARLLESAEAVAASVGLTSARWLVLGAVAEMPKPAAQVARDLGLTRQSVQEIVDAMARDGQLELHDNPHHKRARLIVPTTKARRALDTLKPRQSQFAALMGAPHSVEELQTTIEVLRKTRRSLEGSDRMKP
jgi:DNA-binding MarR family transcriptional regulator